MFKILTEVTVIFHLMFIIFVVVGGFLVRGRRWLIVIHIACIVWAIYAELAPGVICPLTALENYFGYRAGLSTYNDDFITRYLVPIIYQEGLTPFIQYILVGIVFIVNVIAYRKTLKRKLRS